MNAKDAGPATGQRGADTQSMIASVIAGGQSVVHEVGEDQILALIRDQPGVVGEVVIERLKRSGDVGASSGIVLFKATVDEGRGPVTRDLVLRYAPTSDKRLFFEYDMTRQFRVQRALQGRAPVPEPLWLDATGRWLGAPGYVMLAAQGVAPHTAVYAKGPIAEASLAGRERMFEQVMRALVGIHTTDVNAVGLGDFAMNAPGRTPLERCINWYWQTWQWVGLPHYQRLVPVHRWLLDHAPDRAPELMHGDATLHNYMFDGTRLTAVIDWEMSALGNAEADLALQCVGTAMFSPPPGSGGLLPPPSEAEWLQRYRDAGGRAVRDFDYFKKVVAYFILIAIGSLQRNLSEEALAAQASLLQPAWELVEA